MSEAQGSFIAQGFSNAENCTANSGGVKNIPYKFQAGSIGRPVARNRHIDRGQIQADLKYKYTLTRICRT